MRLNYEVKLTESLAQRLNQENWCSRHLVVYTSRVSPNRWIAADPCESARAKLNSHTDDDLFYFLEEEKLWSYSLMRSAAGRFHATFFLLVFLLRGKVAKLVIWNARKHNITGLSYCRVSWNSGGVISLCLFSFHRVSIGNWLVDRRKYRGGGRQAYLAFEKSKSSDYELIRERRISSV